MTYRSGTYVAFYAQDTSDPTESDMKYYNTLRMWDANKDFDFSFVNSHEKSRAVRDSSTKATLEQVLKERLRNSKNMILIIGQTTKYDHDWVPMEIAYSIDDCQIPVIAAYPDYDSILAPDQLSSLWPKALADRISDKSARVIHIPFKKEPIKAAIKQFDHENLPSGALVYYTRETYVKWGLIK